MAGTLVLDSEGLSKLATGDSRARAHLEIAIARRARVVASAMTLTEVLEVPPAMRPCTGCFPGSPSFRGAQGSAATLANSWE